MPESEQRRAVGRHEVFPVEISNAARRVPPLAMIGGVTAIGLAMAGAPLLAGPDPVLAPGTAAPSAPAYQGRLLDPPPSTGPGPAVGDDGIVRVRGRLDRALADALAAGGVEPAVAASFLRTVAERSRGLDIGADDHFDLVADMAAAGGPQLVYAALDRVGASDVQLVRVEGRWVDAGGGGGERQQRPVGGRVTSSFGVRHHPILGYSRMHQGIDFAAAMGQPVVAAASGTIVGAGWAGGYGRQVRIAHGGGLTSSYSHLSAMAVAAGGHVNAGQVIGYAGSSGLSTGPHVHYEVRRNGQAIDPTGARLAGGAVLSPAVAAEVKARLSDLMRIAPRQRG